ncbi:MAG: hypothetical protein OEZ19_00900 [Paracoccaceae bacterium]|nr:hypothetical protein [Paracoccaceae bacterium]
MDRIEELTRLRAMVAGDYGDDQISCVAKGIFGWTNGTRFLASYQGSIDYAKGLHEAVLPGWVWYVRSSDGMDVYFYDSAPGQYFAQVWRAETDINDDHETFYVWDNDPARAWLLAILDALVWMEAA